MTAKQIKDFFFHSQTFLLLPVLLYLWNTIDAFYSYKLTEKDLVPHTGKVMLLDTVYEGTKKDIRKGIEGYFFRFKINTEADRVFKLRTSPSEYSNYYYIISHVKSGDMVTIFTEPELFEGIGRKKSNIISKLVKENKVVSGYSMLKERIYIPMLIIFIAFFLLYFVKARRRYLNAIQPST